MIPRIAGARTIPGWKKVFPVYSRQPYIDHIDVVYPLEISKLLMFYVYLLYMY